MRETAHDSSRCDSAHTEPHASSAGRPLDLRPGAHSAQSGSLRPYASTPLSIPAASAASVTRSNGRTACKILLYSHDTFGLGNIRRTLLLANALREEYPDSAILIVTGSPVIHDFRIPQGVDYIKLPSLDRIARDTYEPRFMSQWPIEIARVRAAVLQQAVLGFSPDLMIVDKRAGGVDGELVDTLAALHRHGRTRIVLGVRDILDEPRRTRVSLERADFTKLVEQYYDEVWIYGDQSLFDAVVEYGFSPGVARKSIYCGYLRRAAVPGERPAGPSRVLVTTGGGGDGTQLIHAYLEGLSQLPRRMLLHTTVVFGPEMPAHDRTDVLDRFGLLADVTFLDFEPDLAARYACADVVVAMAGYGTVCDLLSLNRRAVLVPRAQPVMEQLVRARLLASRGVFQVIEPDELTGERLIAAVMGALEQPPLSSIDLAVDGLTTIRARARRLVDEQP